MLFSFPSLLSGDLGLASLRRDYPALVELAKAVARQPALGVAAYKPPNSPALNDIYLYDHLGMLGIPLVPTPSFPANSPVVLLSTQAAADPALLKELTSATKPGKTFVITPGLFAAAPDGEALARLAGVQWSKTLTPLSAAQVRTPAGDVEVPRGLDLATRLEVSSARVLMYALVDGATVPLLTEVEKDYCRMLVLNLRGYGTADFEATGEVLLSPRELGMIDLPQPACDALRHAIASPFIGELSMPSRMTIHCLGTEGWLVKNYSGGVAEVAIPPGPLGSVVQSIDESIKIKTDKSGCNVLAIPQDGYAWLKPHGG